MVELRRRVGMVFQKSNPFPKSIFDNVAYGLKNQSDDVKPAVSSRDAWNRRSRTPRFGKKLKIV